MEQRGGGLPYVRAIDGLRGGAVVLVLAFHGQVPGFSGGFLGVSVFFTLSGYLITQLLVREHDLHGRISLRSFWGRRLRRLAPASLAALTAVAVAVRFTDLFPGAAVPGDVAAAALDVANWRFAVASTSYESLFSSGPSPVLHFWSLAIEEQFYVLFPLLVVAVLGWLGRRRLPLVLATLAVLGTVASVIAPTDIAYYGTPTRAPELLVGALLALALPIGRPLPPSRQRMLAGAGVVAAVALGVVVVSTNVGSPWLYRGGLPAVSLLSATLIASATVAGPVRRAAAWRPAVAVGRVSYGVYVYHWPLFLVLSEDRLGIGGPALFVVRVTVTAVVAVASAVLLEDPVRRRAILTRASLGGPAFVGALACVLLLAAVAAPAPPPDIVPDVGKELVAFSTPRPTPVLDVLVLGSVPEVDDWVRAARPVGVELRIRSAVREGCPLLLPDRDDGSCLAFARMATAPVPTPSPDLIVVGLGPVDRHEIADELARMTPGSRDAQAATIQALQVSDELLRSMLNGLPAVPVLLVDTTAADPLSRQAVALDLRLGAVTLSRATDAATFDEDLLPLVATLGGDARMRVLVVGDSTSFQLATAIDAAARDRIEVVWAGQQNCPLVQTIGVRWYAGAEFDGTVCPSTLERWPEAVARLRPDVVVAAASLPELSEQRYVAGGRWMEPGSADYVAAHDVGMADLQALLRSDGVLTIVATVPPLAPGKMFDGPLAEPARLQAWLDQLARWDAQWVSVGTVDWAAIATGAEVAAGHDLRVDAVHFDPDSLKAVLAPPLVDALLVVVHRVEADALANGCLVGPDGARTLDLSRCRVAG